MRKFLATLLNRMSSGESLKTRAVDAVEEEEDDVEAFESLAMTDELREALFPKTTQMVSAIFDRPAPLTRRPEAPASPPPNSGDGFPMIF